MVYALTNYGLPILIGAVAGVWGRRRSAGPMVHMILVLAAFFAAEFLLYVSFYLQEIIANGGRLGTSALVGALAGLFSRYGIFFLLVSGVTCLPLTATGYAAGALLFRRFVKSRSPV